MNNIYNVDIMDLTRTELKIHKYLLDNFDNIEEISINNVAEDVFTNVSTITRYAKKIGYKGFKDLKYNNIKKLKRSSEKLSILEKNINSINDLKDQFDQEKLNKIKKHWKQARSILFIASGPSYEVAKTVAIKLRILDMNKNIYCIVNKLENINIIERNNKDLLIIALSNKGETEEIIEVISFSKIFKPYIISITNEVNSSLANFSNTLFITKKDNSLQDVFGYDLNNRFQQLFVLENIIEMCLLENKSK